MPDEPKPKKIIIDEDWKSQVEAEREAAKRQQQETAPGGAPAGEQQAGQIPWPEPSLPLLVTTLATQAMAAMGLMAYPGGGESKTDLSQAKHFIDTIALLEEKTRGNATAEETAMFENVLHELRMAYVAVQEKQTGP